MGKKALKKPKQSEAMKLYWADSAKRAARSVVAKQLWTDPAFAEKTSKAISVGQLERWAQPGYKETQLETNLGLSHEHMQAMSDVSRADPEVLEAQRQASVRFWSVPENHVMMSEKHVALWNEHPERRLAQKVRADERMEDPVYREWFIKAGLTAHDGPNQFEKKYLKLLNKWMPGQWRYTGGGIFVELVGGKCPDFVHNTKKKIVELYGTYWHRGQDPQERIDHFASLGYETLVIWESDNPYQALKKIEEFTNL